jgi:hypothetical protein
MKIKSSGNPCKNDGIYILDGQHLCGVHVPKDRKSQAVAVEKSKTRPTATAPVTLMNVCDELDEAISRRVAINDFSDGSAASSSEAPGLDPRVIKMTTMPQDQRRIIIRRAIELASCQDNVIRVLAHIPAAVSDFLRAISERRMRMSYKPLYISTLKDSEANRAVPSSALCIEEGNTICFPDVDICVANCSKPYLDLCGIRSIGELCEDGDVVYMGPKGALVSPMGVMDPEEDSRWYIPLPVTCKLRTTHNKLKAQEILTAIKNGEEDKQKYLNLRGKTLACICLPYPCHCMIYVDVVRALTVATPHRELVVAGLGETSPAKTSPNAQGPQLCDVVNAAELDEKTRQDLPGSDMGSPAI